MLPYCHHLCISFLYLSLVRTSLSIHAGQLLLPLDIWPVQIDNCWAGRRWSYRINQLSLNLYFSRISTHGICPPRPLNSELLLFWGPELWLCFLVYSFFAACWTPSSHALDIHLPNRFLFIKIWGTAEVPLSAPLLPVSGNYQCTLETSWLACTLLCCPPQISGGSNPHKDQGLWLWGYFQLPEEDFIDCSWSSSPHTKHNIGSFPLIMTKKSLDSSPGWALCIPAALSREWHLYSDGEDREVMSMAFSVWRCLCCSI